MPQVTPVRGDLAHEEWAHEEWAREEWAREVAVVGAGTIGASWTALFLARGLSVRVSDPDPRQRDLVARMIESAWPALGRLGLAADADPAAWRFVADPAEAVAGAGFVQENAPERLDLKRRLYATLEPALDAAAIVASSSSGLTMSAMQQGLATPERFVVGHPFNPPHLIPLVEVVGGAATSAATVARCMAFYRGLGKHPIHLRREAPGHLANRLQAALWREAVHAVAEGLASVSDVDAAIAYGPGLRWAIMGPHMTFHLGGGEGGIAHLIDHLGSAIEGWWTTLGAPELTPELRRRLIEGVAEEADGRDIAALARERDATLLDLLEARARAGAA